MPAVPKPIPHKGVGERYDAARQGFLEQQWNYASTISENAKPAQIIPCQCSLPDRCPRAMRVVIDRITKGGEHPGATAWFEYHTDGDCHHRIPRSRRPDLREDLANIFLLSRFCHRVVKHGGRKGAK